MSKWDQDYFWYCDKCGSIARTLEITEDKLFLTDDRCSWHKNCGGIVDVLRPTEIKNFKTITEIENMSEEDREKEIAAIRKYVQFACEYANKHRIEREAFLAKCCPNCGAPPQLHEQISSLRRAFSVATWGLASNKIGKTKRCKKCGHMW